MYIKSLFFFFALHSVIICGAQQSSNSLHQYIRWKDSIHQTDAREKIFIHFDRSYYELNDTMWVKGYILNGVQFTATDSSRLVYIDFTDINGHLIKRVSPICYHGLFSASITLGNSNFKQGKYSIRAYTNRMRNYGDSLFFKTQFTILNVNKNRGQAGSDYSITTIKNAKQVGFKKNGNAINQIPDLQFLPEGGTCVGGIPQRIGFKAIDINGKARDVGGIIKDNFGVHVATFQSIHKGMGFFELKPKAGVQYYAVTNNGQKVLLPTVAFSGISLRVNNEINSDSLSIIIRNTPDLINKKIFITGSIRGLSYLQGSIMLSANSIVIKVAKSNLVAGVFVIRLLNENLQPLNERATFINKDDSNFNIILKTDKEVYSQRDSVIATVEVTDENKQPVMGSFSVAVIDTSKTIVDINSENIRSYMLLSSDVRGNIEEPGYYLKHKTDNNAVEALLLTQGWVSYERSPTPHKYSYDKEFTINGEVIGGFNVVHKNSRVLLYGNIGGTHVFFKDTITNEKGRFTFDNFPASTSEKVVLVVNAYNKNDKKFNVNLNIKDKKFPEWESQKEISSANTLFTDSSVMQQYLQQKSRYKFDSTFLQEVVVVSKMKIKGSHNFNDGADQVIAEAELAKTPKLSLFDIIQKNIKGVYLDVNGGFKYKKEAVRIVIDGVSLQSYIFRITGGSPLSGQIIEDVLRSLKGDDIRGIEVMTSTKYATPYASRYIDNPQFRPKGVFLEVTTKGGSGPHINTISGRRVIRPVYPIVSRNFYVPPYLPNEQSKWAHLKETLFWNADMLTDENGNARFKFYTQGSKSDCIVIINGVDLNGKIGFSYSYINVE